MTRGYKMVRTLIGLILLLLSAVSSAHAQRERSHLPFSQVARFARLVSPEDVVRRHLAPYCFDTLDNRGMAMITDSVRARDPMASPIVIFDYIRQHPCETPGQPDTPQNTPRTTPRREPSPPPALVPAPPPPSSLSNGERLTQDGRCLVNQSSETTRRDLRIPRIVRYIYVFLQTPGPAEEAESERVGTAMEKDEFYKCFDAFRERARRLNMRLIITATDARHRGWYQPEIIYRGQPLRPVEYRVPGGDRTEPGAEVPVN